jgi:endonuclease G
MKKLKSITQLSTLCFALLAIGCTAGKEIDPELPQELTFTADIDGTAQTRVTDTRWDRGDRIGVFMTDHSGGATLAANKRYYTATTSGVFTAFEQTDRVEKTAEATVDLWAYYPHTDGAEGFNVPVDITDQSDQSRLDVLHATAGNVSNFSPPPTFAFSRQMVRLVFNVTAGEGIYSLGGLKATVSGVPTLASMDVKSGEMTIDSDSDKGFEGKVTSTGATTAKVEVTLLYDVTAKPVVTFTLGGNPFVWKVTETLAKGSRYTRSVTLTDKGGEVKTYKYFETPLIPTLGGTDLVYNEHNLPTRKARNFQMLYDTKEHIAYWVSYPMCNFYQGPTSRNEEWQYDPKVPVDKQANLSGGWGGSGYDRGHQLASADRNYNVEEMHTTYYYTNMTPQNSTLNQGQWGELEGKVRGWRNGCDTLYVVTGAILPPVGQREYRIDRSDQPIAIPLYYFKALARRHNATDTYETIAFKVDNKAPSGTLATWSSWKISVTELENATGFTFFPGLPDPSVKNSFDSTIWQ